jgi:hypothetical protein
MDILILVLIVGTLGSLGFITFLYFWLGMHKPENSKFEIDAYVQSLIDKNKGVK